MKQMCICEDISLLLSSFFNLFILMHPWIPLVETYIGQRRRLFASIWCIYLAVTQLSCCNRVILTMIGGDKPSSSWSVLWRYLLQITMVEECLYHLKTNSTHLVSPIFMFISMCFFRYVLCRELCCLYSTSTPVPLWPLSLYTCWLALSAIICVFKSDIKKLVLTLSYHVLIVLCPIPCYFFKWNCFSRS